MKRTKYVISKLRWSDFMPPEDAGAYFYEGSFAVAQCMEIVSVLVFDMPIVVEIVSFMFFSCNFQERCRFSNIYTESLFKLVSFNHFKQPTNFWQSFFFRSAFQCFPPYYDWHRQSMVVFHPLFAAITIRKLILMRLAISLEVVPASWGSLNTTTPLCSWLSCSCATCPLNKAYPIWATVFSKQYFWETTDLVHLTGYTSK